MSIVERNVEVSTPESIAFSYELAGLGSRFLAVVLDLMIQLAVLLAGVTVVLQAASTAQKALLRYHIPSSLTESLFMATIILHCSFCSLGTSYFLKHSATA